VRSRERLLERVQFLPRPLGEVFAFFSDARNLQRLTPPWLDFAILGPPPAAMAPGVLLDYRIRLGGVPMRWRSLIETWEPGVRFTDVQVRGPYASWHHLHEFHAAAGGTVMRDRVRYRLPGGAVGDLAHGPLVGPSLRRIFAFRRASVAAALPPRPAAR
jgi:ligand-binding SRPBCC domain-containing protein